MDYTSVPLKKLAEQFERMPGIGRKTAQRIAFYILGLSAAESSELVRAINDACTKIHRCSVCCNLTEQEICPICSNIKRDKKTVCVVEDTQDLMAIENTHEYKGVYHVLNGAISPLDGITPDRLCIKELLARISEGEIEEIIIATNSNSEGEATAIYLSRLLSPLGVKVTRLAYGLPIGMNLQYADNVTLAKAIEGRQIF